MKVYKDNSDKIKHWVMRLEEEGDNCVNVSAVDRNTGAHIAVLISFFQKGTVEVCMDAKRELEVQGYDPREHGNEFDEEGRLCISCEQ